MKTQTDASQLLNLVKAYRVSSGAYLQGLTGEGAPVSDPGSYGVAAKRSGGEVKHRDFYDAVEARLADGAVSSQDLAAIASMVNLSGLPAEQIRATLPANLGPLVATYGAERVLLLKSAFEVADTQGSLRTALESAQDLVHYIRDRATAEFSG